jgi:hypothetical protein
MNRTVGCKRAMGSVFRVGILLLILAACGGMPKPSPGFVNQTQHTDADLWAIWNVAQKSVAQQIDLNPIQQQSSGADPDIRPGDARALNVQPLQVQVTGQPDVSAAQLFAAAAVVRSDPTGLIACPQPCNVRYAAAYSFYSTRETKYAQSWESQGDNFNMLLQYEFESHILYALGYDVKWR